MKIDYNKKNFTEEEKIILLNESNILKESYPTRIPILVQLNSNILKIDKNKFLVQNEITLGHYLDILKKKLLDTNSNDTLIISVVKFNGNSRNLTKINSQSKLLKDFFAEYKDESTGMLILSISRQTNYKYIKGTLNYFLGY